MIPVPTMDNIVLEEIERDKITGSGIHLPCDPHSLAKVPNRGKVIRVGPGRFTREGKHVPMQVKAGDTVIFAKTAGVEIKHNDTTYLVVTERDVLAIEAD